MQDASSGPRAPKLAVFDLDGTMTRRDTMLPYLLGWMRRHPGHGGYRSIVVALWHYLRRGRDRGRLKTELMRRLMPGAARAEVTAWTEEFVAGLDGMRFYPGALTALEAHRRAGDRLVLLSASVDLYVPRIGARFGFDETVCTGVAWDGDRLEGALTTPNRRAGEKRRCIEALRARFPGLTIAAYANSGSDLEHLGIVERPLLVNAGFRARRAARRLGIPVADWRNKQGVLPV